MTGPCRSGWIALVVLLLLTLLNGLLWSAATPLWQGTDENGHFAATQFIAEHLRLPGPDDEFRADEMALAADLADVGKLPYHPELRQSFAAGADGPHEAELRALPPATRTSYARGAPGKLNHTSPLYYVLGAFFYRLAHGGDLLARLYAVRLLSIVLTMGMVLLSYLVAAEISPGRRDVPLTVATLVSFQPMLSFIGAIVNNDILVSLLTTAAIWVLMRIWLRGLTLRRAVSLGVSLGLGMLAKPLIAGLTIPVALVFARAWWRGRGQRWPVILNGVLALALALVLCGWWQVRSLALNDGELYMDEIKKGYRIVDRPSFDYRGHFWAHATDYYASILGGVWGSYWAAFGWLDTAAAPIYYRAIDALTALGLAGQLIYLFTLLRRRAWDKAGIMALSIAIVLSPIVMMHVYDFSYWSQHGIGRGLQGRYFFGQMAPLFLLVLTGLLFLLPKRWHSATHLALRIGIIVANFYCLLRVILPRYYS
jgi:4-amino-4-deoxy-L-arabinose transferase-like glycosyltransferase